MSDVDGPDQIARPAFGLTLEEAYRAFSDPGLVAEADQFSSASWQLPIFFPGSAPSPYEIRHAAYWRIRTPLEKALRSRLQSGALVSTGFEVPVSPSSTREVINPELWRILEPDFEESKAQGAGMTVVDVLIFEPDTLSQRALPVLSRDETKSSYGCANANFSVVRLDQNEFHFGLLQAAALRRLQAASLTEDPWLVGKVLLQDIGANSRSIGDLFRRHTNPSWRILIEEMRGRYRLTRRIEVSQSQD